MGSVLFESHFHNEDAAYDYVEARLWPDGPACPRCGIKGNIGKLQGKSSRRGLYKCYVCREQFTVKVGTIFESSHLPLRMWLQAIHLLCASKKHVSARQLQRMLGVGRQTAWHLGCRIRKAMRDRSPPPLGGAGATTEVDEFRQGLGVIVK
jgi:transposase-like protein